MSERDSITVALPIPPASLSLNGRVPWQQVARDKAAVRREAMWAVFEAIYNAGQPAEWESWRGPVRVHVVWSMPNPRWLPDVDGATARCKPILDGAEDARLFANDRQITGITVERVVGPRGLTVTFRREEHIEHE